MSLPSLSYCCAKCDYNRFDLFIWGHRYYQISENKFPLKATKGWCYKCTDLSAIEVLPSQESIDKLIKLIFLKRSEFETLKKEHSNTLRWWKKLTELPSEILHVKFDYKHMERQLSDMQKTFAALSSRQNGPCCLQCGSEEHMVLPPHRPSGIKPVPIGFKHPTCGGELLIRDDGTRFMLKPCSIAYDIEGNKLSE